MLVVTASAKANIYDLCKNPVKNLPISMPSTSVTSSEMSRSHSETKKQTIKVFNAWHAKYQTTFSFWVD